MEISFPSEYRQPDYQKNMRLQLGEAFDVARLLGNVTSADIQGRSVPELKIPVQDPQTELMIYHAASYQIDILLSAYMQGLLNKIKLEDMLSHYGYFDFMSQEVIFPQGFTYETSGAIQINNGMIQFTGFIHGRPLRQVILDIREIPLVMLTGSAPSQLDINFYYGEANDIYEFRDSWDARTLILHLGNDEPLPIDIITRDHRPALAVERSTHTNKTKTFYRFNSEFRDGRHYLEARHPVKATTERTIHVTMPNERDICIIEIDQQKPGIASAEMQITYFSPNKVTQNRYKTILSDAEIPAEAAYQLLLMGDNHDSVSQLIPQSNGAITLTYSGVATNDKTVMITDFAPGMEMGINYGGEAVPAGKIKLRPDGLIVARLADERRVQIRIGPSLMIEEVKVLN